MCKTHMPSNCQPPHDHNKYKQLINFTINICGHAAKKMCYQDDAVIACKKPCKEMMECRIHPCQNKCSSIHPHHYCIEKMQFNCSKCENLNDKMCSETEPDVRCEAAVNFIHSGCGHSAEKRCYEDSLKLKCTSPCSKQLSKCRHPCTLKCGDPCNKNACKPYKGRK